MELQTLIHKLDRLKRRQNSFAVQGPSKVKYIGKILDSVAEKEVIRWLKASLYLDVFIVRLNPDTPGNFNVPVKSQMIHLVMTPLICFKNWLTSFSELSLDDTTFVL